MNGKQGELPVGIQVPFAKFSQILMSMKQGKESELYEE
jgi:hypothetical protein